MFAVQVELLTGRYVATRHNDRSRVEWPPHPARLFSAAVAAWADTDEPDPDERAALIWWEQQGAPSISCSWDDQWSERSAVTHYVPDNDLRVVARDTSKTYVKLREAHEELAAARASDDPKKIARTEKQLAKQQAKATEDSVRVASADQPAPAGAKAILPDHRSRQGRIYPTAIPADDRITYTWEAADPASPHIAVLDRLLGRVARLGHSSSMVSVSLVDEAPPPVLVPDERGWAGIRIASQGQLDALETAFAHHQGSEPRTLPAEIAPYREAQQQAAQVPGPVFSADDWLLLNSSRRFGIRDTLGLARRLRQTLMYWSDPSPEIISGHIPGADGERTAPSSRPHLAVVPLPFVDHPYADGLVQAIALVFPDHVPAEDRQAVLMAVGRWLDEGGGELRLGRQGVATFSGLDRVDAPVTAQPSRWTRPAQRWLTATPIALDRNPGQLTHRDPAKRMKAEAAAAETIRRSCTNIGLPSPTSVSVGFDAPTSGTRPTQSFPRYSVRDGRLQRLLVHAEVIFDEPVRGPMLLGAGRYLGYGLLTPAPLRAVAAEDEPEQDKPPTPVNEVTDVA